MNVKKREKYVANLYAALHTMSGRCSDLDLSKAQDEAIVKTSYPKDNQYYIQLNPNKAIGATTMIKSFSESKKVLDEALDRMGAEDFRINRADLSFNSNDSADYDLFKKINRLLICCIADAYQIDNCYNTSDLWTDKSLSIAIKDRRIEAENYDKEWESKGKTEAKNRLELRSKNLRSNDLKKEFTVKWAERLDRALEHFEAVQERYNFELCKNWNEDQAKAPKYRKYSNFTVFILSYQDCIFTKKQLINLYEMVGNQNPEGAAKRFKDRHHVEFFSKTDLKTVINAIKKCATEYFAN